LAVGDVYEILLGGHLFGQECLNVFHYMKNTGTGEPSLETFLSVFKPEVVEEVAAMVSNQFTWDRLRIKDVNINGGEREELGPFQTGGLTSAEDLPPFCAWSFLMQRFNRLTFHGHKRFAGVPEALQDDGIPVSTAVTLAVDVSAALSATLTIGSHTYSPCIYSRYFQGELRPTPVVNPIVDAVFKGISTQNTRKFGRGS